MKKFYQSKKFWTGLTSFVAGVGFLITGEQTAQEAFMTLSSALFTVLTVFFTKDAIE